MTSSKDNQWIYAGLASSFPDIKPAAKKTKIHDTSCENTEPPPCRILQLSDESNVAELSLDEAQLSLGLKPQVMVFRYRGKLHAITHDCPHRSYPLSRGSVYDIEDFGIILSAGIVCPKHAWSFDLFTGESDRGSYKLGVWDVDTREGKDGEEVWVRRKG